MNEPAAYLLGELASVRDENRALRRRVRELERSRTYWRDAARIRGWANRWNRGYPSQTSTVSTVSTGSCTG